MSEVQSILIENVLITETPNENAECECVANPGELLEYATPKTEKIKRVEHVEPILKEDDSRYVMFPVKHNDVWQMYKKQVDSFWRVE